MRTFVFISNIPNDILQPVEEKESSSAGRRPGGYRNLAYERLRQLLVSHSSGVMLVMHLGENGGGYGLALYASEKEALAACKTPIFPPRERRGGGKHDSDDHEEDEKTREPLRLRILQKEAPPPLEEVYRSTITIDGEVVAKSELATTRGLELVYRGKAVPKWCPETKQGEDCVFGVSCHKIHLAKFQRTTRKRPRELMEGGMSNAEEEAMHVLLRRAHVEARVYQEIVPRPLQFGVQTGLRETASHGEDETFLLIPLAETELKTWFSTSFDQTSQEMEKLLVGRVRVALEKRKMTPPYFFRLTCEGGSPWEWALSDEEVGLPTLRQRCPFPENGAPTALERDALIQKLVYWLNQLNAFTDASSGVAAIRRSEKVRASVHLLLNPTGKEEGEKRREITKKSPPPPTPSASSSYVVCIKVLPWVYLPTVAAECSLFIEDARSGRCRGLAQRRGQLRIMTSELLLRKEMEKEKSVVVNAANTALLLRVDDALSRIAVLQRGADEEAEALLARELETYSKGFIGAADLMRQHLRKMAESEDSNGDAGAMMLPSTAGLTVNFAMTHETGSEVRAGSDLSTGLRPVVLSIDTYQRGLQRCALNSRFLSQQGRASSRESKSRNVGISCVEWNQRHHAFEALFQRDVLERLKPPASKDVKSL